MEIDKERLKKIIEQVKTFFINLVDCAKKFFDKIKIILKNVYNYKLNKNKKYLKRLRNRNILYNKRRRKGLIHV